MEDRLGAVRVVLCRTRNPLNLGAAARALKNAGLSRWALVDPQTRDFEAARRVAVHAEDLLEQPRILDTLDEALSGCVLSVGTTVRARPERSVLTPRQAAEKLLAAQGEVAVVFGDERSGLTAEEVERVDLVSAIPSAPEQPSWNLAQAIAVYAYELRAAALQLTPRSRSPRAEADPGSVAAVDRALAAAAAGAGKPGARRRLFRALDRAQLSGREAALWTAFLRAVTPKK